MTTLHQITITRSGNVLTLPSPPVELKAETDYIEWTFEGVGTNEHVVIEFKHQTFGPLQTLVTDRNLVLGLGNTGQTGEFPYTAIVRENETNVVMSEGRAALVNLANQVNSSPFATLNLNEASPEVKPHQLQVAVGGNAEWKVTGLPSDVDLRFHFAPEHPFHFFELGPPSNGTRIATGTGLKEHGDKITYSINLAGPDGLNESRVPTTFDPVIEPLGWPPPQGGEELSTPGRREEDRTREG